MFSLHKIPVSVLFISLFLSASGSDPHMLPAGAAEAGMSYSCNMKPGFWSSFHNQALLPFNTSLSFGVNYHNRFMISELGTRTAGLVIPAEKACLGILYSQSGYKDLMRHTAGVACGLRLSEKISAGIQSVFFAEESPGEDNGRRSITFEAGISIMPSEKIRIGVHLFNPIPNSLRNNLLPSALRAGAGIYLNRLLFASAEAEISTGGTLNFKTGFEYETGERFLIRGGFSSENTSFSFGMGYTIRFAQIDMGFTTHERLGISSSISMIFKLK